MDATVDAAAGIDFERFRLRSFLDALIARGEVTIHDGPVPLADISPIIEETPGPHYFRKAGPEAVELVGAIGGTRARVALAMGVPVENVAAEYHRRLNTPQPVVEVPSAAAPVHRLQFAGDAVDLTRLPFHAQHEYDGSVYISSGIDFTVDPETGRTNVGCRRLSLRNRYEAGTNLTSPSDLKAIFRRSAAKGERLPVSFAVGSGLLDFIATAKLSGDELGNIARLRAAPLPVVRCLTNDLLVPADAEMILEGYLDERGYFEPEGPYGEYMGYYGPMHLDPVFRCTAIVMRADVLHQTWLHGSAPVLHRTDFAMMFDIRTESAIRNALKGVIGAPGTLKMQFVYGAPGHLRLSFRQTKPGEVRAAMHTVFGAIPYCKHLFVYDDDIDIADDRHCSWAMSTRFQADRDLVLFEGLHYQRMDPSRDGKEMTTKAGFDCTGRFGREDTIMLRPSRAGRIPRGTARCATVAEALGSGPRYFTELMADLGSDDGREIAVALDELRVAGRLGRDRFGRYHLADGTPGQTAIVGGLDHDPND